MLPSGFIAAAFLLSLVPGWWFLRRTESERRPRELSAIQETLELVAVGVLTTGLVAFLGVALWPELVLEFKWPATSAREVRFDAAILIATMLAATTLAEIAVRVSRYFNRRSNAETNIGVWWATFRPDKVPPGQLAYVALVLTDGSTVEGVLDSYTWHADVIHRDIALMAPIKFTEASSNLPWQKPELVKKLPSYDRLIVPATQIKHVALKYTSRETVDNLIEEDSSGSISLVFFAGFLVAGALIGGFGFDPNSNWKILFGLSFVLLALISGLVGMQQYAKKSDPTCRFAIALENLVKKLFSNEFFGPLLVGLSAGTGMGAGIKLICS